MARLTVLKPLVENILRHWQEHEWSVQGFGMIRTYLDSDKQFRLNVWTSKLAIPGSNHPHDHPWHFTSYIVAGRFYNTRYQRIETGKVNELYDAQVIRTGEGGGPEGAPVQQIFLRKYGTEHYFAGDHYRQKAKEIHTSGYDDGTVTINNRTRLADGDHALVAWQGKFINADPRSATDQEVRQTIEYSLATWFR